jgi:hypothetical protein
MARKRLDRRDERRRDALIRNDVWAGFTPVQQLDLLDRNLGVGIGAKKQRARIARLIK